MAKKIMTAASAFVLFGAELSSDPEFLNAALAYPEDLFSTAEVLRLSPALLHPILSPVLMRNHKAMGTLVEHLAPLVEWRLSQARRGLPFENTKEEKPKDCIQFFVDANNHKKEWTAQKIIQVLLGTWYAAIHQPALTLVYALQDICDNADYLDALRQEVSQIYPSLTLRSECPSSIHKLENAPLLDAFFKESSRLHPSDSISVRRKVISPFTFHDGSHVFPGDVACVPPQAVMTDERYYTDSMKFSPWRFIRDNTDGDPAGKCSRSISKFTDTDFKYPFWGLGRHSW
ncbi:hypothetical protein JX265_013191 [Neoarthrinium moseri]|uniref:Cytochrome P450 n=1 Tax=Neoarthrinium moseri TaxID=1658444 RepID=A0A9P9W9E4_9PEZI|nr:hypothetical protein JX265_013191 [Neoarthrinium moseri]